MSSNLRKILSLVFVSAVFLTNGPCDNTKSQQQLEELENKKSLETQKVEDKIKEAEKKLETLETTHAATEAQKQALEQEKTQLTNTIQELKAQLEPQLIGNFNPDLQLVN